jgi:phosphopentomutase
VKKVTLGIIIGIVFTLSFHEAWLYYKYHRYEEKADFVAFDIAKDHIERTLVGARVLDVSVSPSSAKVNYVYDKLYDAHINYERDGKIKSIVAHYGITRGTWIVPNTSELEILDDKAKVIYEK